MRTVTVKEPLLELHCTLGEGCVWDGTTQRLYFVDIDQRKVYTYEPSTGVVGYQVFDHKVTALALVQDRPGLVAAIDEGFAYIPPSSIPFPPDSTRKPLIKFGFTEPLGAKEKRFNEGACDPAGRLLAGTLGYEHGSKDGRMFAVDQTGTSTLVLDGITCTNGMGWSPDSRTMYFTDSWIKEIAAFDYDVDTGRMSNRRIFSNVDGYGEPDGMCQDTEGGIWTCRWAAGKILRLDAAGKIDVVVDFPTAWHVTCCIFGGPTLEDLYVTTASSDYIGDDLPERFDGGNVFVVKGLGFKGVDRFRYKGLLP